MSKSTSQKSQAERKISKEDHSPEKDKNSSSSDSSHFGSSDNKLSTSDQTSSSAVIRRSISDMSINMNADSAIEEVLPTISEESLSNVVSIIKHHEDLLALANSITKALKDGTKKHEIYEKVDDIKIRIQRSQAMVLLQANKIRSLEAEVQHQQHCSKETDILPEIATYAETASHFTTPPSGTSKSAILIRRKPSSNMTMSNIRDILNRYAKNNNQLPKVSCTLSRDKNTFIVKTEKEDEIGLLADRLHNYETLQDIAEIEIRPGIRRKLIFLGIPKDTPKTDVLNKLNTDLNTDIQAHICKVLEKDDAKTYQLVVEMDESYAKYFLNKGKLLLSFNSCKIQRYSPVIRCNNCQYYGHSQDRCRFKKPTCAYCAKNHSSTSCPIKDDQQKHICINCRDVTGIDGKLLDHHHSANSKVCHLFQRRIYNRNQATNYIQGPSRN